MVAGEIAAALAVAPTNLSFHLKALTQAGLLTVTQEGRFLRYCANLPLMFALIAYLTDECCGGHPERCADLMVPARGPGGGVTTTFCRWFFRWWAIWRSPRSICRWVC